MNDRTSLDRLARELDRRQETDELTAFARRLERIARQPVPGPRRQAIWNEVLAAAPPARTAAQGPGPISQPRLRARHIGRGRLGIVPQALPAPAVVLFGIVIAVMIALSGVGSGDDPRVTPTAYAEAPATAISSPGIPEQPPTATVVAPEE